MFYYNIYNPVVIECMHYSIQVMKVIKKTLYKRKIRLFSLILYVSNVDMTGTVYFAFIVDVL